MWKYRSPQEASRGPLRTKSLFAKVPPEPINIGNIEAQPSHWAMGSPSSRLKMTDCVRTRLLPALYAKQISIEPHRAPMLATFSLIAEIFAILTCASKER